MEKTATLNLRLNPAVKERAENVLSQLGIPMSFESVNADLMLPDEIHEKLQNGLDDAEKGIVRIASEAFAAFRENH